MSAKLRAAFAWFVARARAAHEDDEGGAMVFGAITLFTLALFIVLVFHVGMASGTRIQIQTAADAGAYSGALVEAEALESIAFLNDGMSFVYYTGLRYTVDMIVYSTLNAFWVHDRWVVKPSSQTRPITGITGIQRVLPTRDDQFLIFEGPGLYPKGNARGWFEGVNPGARPTSQYLAGVDPDNPGPAPGLMPLPANCYDFVEMGLPSGLFRQRYERSLQHSVVLLPMLKKWLADMHWAERVILAATPRMVERTAVRVAQANGAEVVAVSNDLNDVFRFAQGTQQQDNAGFSEGDRNSKEVDGSLPTRYERIANPIDKRKRSFPSWFDKLKGRATDDRAYSQVRLCWNKRDWDHSPKAPDKYAEHDMQNGKKWKGPPNGHWHSLHVHNLEFVDLMTGDRYPVGPYLGIQQDHDFGHGILEGDDADMHEVVFQSPRKTLKDFSVPGVYELVIAEADTQAPSARHHAAQTCPTCYGDQGPRGWSQVKHVLRDGALMAAEEALGSGSEQNMKKLTELTFDGQDDVLPRPIRLRGPVFRAGVTVAAYAKSAPLGRLFPASPYGFLAVASAQIGVRGRDGSVAVAETIDDQTVRFMPLRGNNGRVFRLVDSADDAPENLYLGFGGNNDPGLRFGARLVPIARPLTWAGTGNNPAGDGLNTLLNGERWFTSPSAQPGKGPSMTELQKMIDVSKSPSAFAH